MQGLGRIFSKKNVVELLKNILKIIILINFLYSIIKADIIPIAKMVHMDIQNSSLALVSWCLTSLPGFVESFWFIALFDFMYQKWEYENNLKDDQSRK